MQWLEANQQSGLKAEYVWNQTSFDRVNPQTTDRLLGKDVNFLLTQALTVYNQYVDCLITTYSKT